MSSASSEREEAERWLRLLRMHGEVGRALQGLGVGEIPLEAASTEPAAAISRHGSSDVGVRVEQVFTRACEFAGPAARERSAPCTSSSRPVALRRSLDRELYRRGGSREELLVRLKALRATA